MHPSAWAAVLRHIPAEQQHLFSLVTQGGAEISVAALVRIEDEFAIVRGRLSGSQDSGRVFFVPYANIDYFGYTNPVKEEDYAAMFDSLEVPKAAAEEEAPAPPARPSVHDRPAIRSEVLERFRQRPNQP